VRGGVIYIAELGVSPAQGRQPAEINAAADHDPTQQDPTQQDPTQQDPTHHDPTHHDPTHHDVRAIPGTTPR
jgi:hypothetical protein